MRRIVAAAGVVGAIALGTSVVLAGDEEARGLDTTCGDFVKLSHEQQAAVIHESGLWQKHELEGAAYYRDACSQHPEDSDDPIRYNKG